MNYEEINKKLNWIKFADSASSGMSNFPEGKNFIGFIKIPRHEESFDYEDYEWHEMKQESLTFEERLELIESRLDNLEIAVKENTTSENSDVNGNIKRGHKISRAPNGMTKISRG